MEPERVGRRDAERVYAKYPRKVAKLAAMRAIEKALLRLRDELRDDRPELSVCGHAERVDWLCGRVETFALSPAGRNGM